MNQSSSLPGLVLVTGASGFLGRNICDQLAAARLPTRSTGRRRSPPHDSSRYHAADLSLATARREVLAGVETLVHCVGLAHQLNRVTSPQDYFNVNAELTRNVVADAAASGVRRVVLISSSSIYGAGRLGVDESADPNPETPYAESKLAAELIASELCANAGVGLTVLRPCAMYGVGDPGNLCRLIESVVSGRFVWIGRGENLKSLLAVEDAARAVAEVIAESPSDSREVFNLAAPPLTIREIVEAIAMAANRRRPIVRIPARLVQPALRFVSNANLGGPRVLRLSRTVDKWLSDDTIDAGRFDRRFSFSPWRDFRVACSAEVRWVIDRRPGTLRAAG